MGGLSPYRTAEMTLLTRQALRKQQQVAGYIVRPSIATGRVFSTSRTSRDAVSTASGVAAKAKPHTIDPKWFTQVKTRIGKCLMFGLKPAQVEDAGDVLRQLARDWRELIAGSEGYLTGKSFRGLFKHNVVWGEMVCCLLHLGDGTVLLWGMGEMY